MTPLPKRPLVVSTEADPSPEFYLFAEPGRALIVRKYGIAIRGSADGRSDCRSRVWRLSRRSLVLVASGIAAVLALGLLIMAVYGD